MNKRHAPIGARPPSSPKALVTISPVLNGKRSTGGRTFTVYGDPQKIIAVVEAALKQSFANQRGKS